MPKFRNVTDQALHLGRPDGDGPLVGPNQDVEVEGSVKELPDAYLVGPSKAISGYGKDDADVSELRLYPKTIWSQITTKSKESPK